jgi:OMF family outer membrane factor
MLCLGLSCCVFSPAFGAPADSAQPQLRPAINASETSQTNKLDAIMKQSEYSESGIFVEENKVSVKAPLLTALIELHPNMSPYNLDAIGGQQITLRDVLLQELRNNLDIGISQTETQTFKWNYRSILGGFLPNITNQFNYQGITGRYASPFGVLSSLSTPYMTIPSGLNWNFFDSGTIFGAQQAKHQYKAAKFDLQRTTNDLLLEGTHLYYQMVLQEVLLQIRIKAVETSEALVEKNQIQNKFGANTQLDLLQAQTQLARDQQALISQQVARRKSAVALATNLNLNSGADLLLSDRVVSQVRLVADNAKIADLVQIAIDNRPELKKWEEERLAAKAAIRLAFAPLLPTVTGSAGLATTGARVSPITSNASAASAAGTGAFGTGSFSTSTVASTGPNSSAKSFNLAEIYLIGIGVQWNIGGLGLTQAAQVKAARSLAREAQLKFARELSWVCKQVRDAYLDSIEAEKLIEATNAEVRSSRQQLKVAVIRLQEGVGTDLDVVNAQRDFTGALIAKANSIVQFNEAQAQLLRALGKISVDGLTSARTTPL